ncbi:MAG TPA: TraR/DksA C4-type zinc finger protein [Streptosporangiaceae bacterium]|jgi:RNA polymerase-binding transcription factor DksA
MPSAGLDQREPARTLLPLPGGLPHWRSRLEDLWRRQLEEVIELSLAFHEAASGRAEPGRPDQARERAREVRQIRAGTAAAHRALAEIEAALGRIDAARFGLCEQCGAPVPASLLARVPQARYCPQCSAPAGQRPWARSAEGPGRP